MATRNSTRGRSKRPRISRRRIVRALQQSIDSERRKLHQAIAILKCLEYASLYAHEGDHIDSYDVAQTARNLIDEADSALDGLTLRGAR
jgi:hypothetical protein